MHFLKWVHPLVVFLGKNKGLTNYSSKKKMQQMSYEPVSQDWTISKQKKTENRF